MTDSEIIDLIINGDRNLYRVLVDRYQPIVRENAEKFKGFSNYVLADAYFAKRPFVEAVLSVDMHLISRLRDDSVLKFRFTGERTGKQGAPRNFPS